jgi:hypothetical protein
MAAARFELGGEVVSVPSPFVPSRELQIGTTSISPMGSLLAPILSNISLQGTPSRLRVLVSEWTRPVALTCCNEPDVGSLNCISSRQYPSSTTRCRKSRCLVPLEVSLMTSLSALKLKVWVGPQTHSSLANRAENLEDRLGLRVSS